MWSDAARPDPFGVASVSFARLGIGASPSGVGLGEPEPGPIGGPSPPGPNGALPLVPLGGGRQGASLGQAPSSSSSSLEGGSDGSASGLGLAAGQSAQPKHSCHAQCCSDEPAKLRHQPSQLGGEDGGAEGGAGSGATGGMRFVGSHVGGGSAGPGSGDGEGESAAGCSGGGSSPAASSGLALWRKTLSSTATCCSLGTHTQRHGAAPKLRLAKTCISCCQTRIAQERLKEAPAVLDVSSPRRSLLASVLLASILFAGAHVGEHVPTSGRGFAGEPHANSHARRPLTSECPSGVESTQRAPGEPRALAQPQPHGWHDRPRERPHRGLARWFADTR